MPAQKGKMHWTKRMSKEEVRRRLTRGRRKAAAEITRKPKKEKGHDVQTEAVVAYAFGKVEAILEGLAAGAGIPASVLTARVARLLDSKASGELLRLKHHLPGM